MTIPVCYLIGDSISIDYGDQLSDALQGKVDYRRKDGVAEAKLNLDDPRGANGGDSSMVLRYLQAWAEETEPPKHELLLVNCGLHDIKVHKETGEIVISQEAYRANLQAIVNLSPKLANQFAWIRTTPVDDERHAQRTRFGFHRYERDVQTYNAIADEVMQAAGVPIIDLHSFTLACPGELFRDGVHFAKPVIREQALWLAGWVLGRLS